MIKKPSKELIAFQDAANNLVAIRMVQECNLQLAYGPVELESFVEAWIKLHIIKPDIALKRSLWRCFLAHWQMNLKERRRRV